MRWAVGFMVVALCAPMAQAGKIYKCVKDGRVTYSSLRCEDGPGQAIAPPVMPTDEMVARSRMETEILIHQQRRAEAEATRQRWRDEYNAEVDRHNAGYTQRQERLRESLAEDRKVRCERYRKAIEDVRIAAVRSRGADMTKLGFEHQDYYNKNCR
jgi:hypothetical protein